VAVINTGPFEVQGEKVKPLIIGEPAGLAAGSLIVDVAGCYLAPILNILVPHTGQTPWVAGRPFFMVMALGFFISLLVRHLTQYPCMATLL
jgi:hypothetical protein